MKQGNKKEEKGNSERMTVIPPKRPFCQLNSQITGRSGLMKFDEDVCG